MGPSKGRTGKINLEEVRQPIGFASEQHFSL